MSADLDISVEEVEVEIDLPMQDTPTASDDEADGAPLSQRPRLDDLEEVLDFFHV